MCARIGWSYRASTRISATQHASVPIPHPVRLQLSLRQPSDERLDARISGAGEDPRRRVASYAWPLSSRRVPLASAAVPPTDASPVPPLSLARSVGGPLDRGDHLLVSGPCLVPFTSPRPSVPRPSVQSIGRHAERCSLLDCGTTSIIADEAQPQPQPPGRHRYLPAVARPGLPGVSAGPVTRARWPAAPRFSLQRPPRSNAIDRSYVLAGMLISWLSYCSTLAFRCGLLTYVSNRRGAFVSRAWARFEVSTRMVFNQSNGRRVTCDVSCVCTCVRHHPKKRSPPGCALHSAPTYDLCIG